MLSTALSNRQVVEPDASSCRILMVDLAAEAGKADTMSVLASWLAREAAVPFEPYSAPPVRAMLAQLGDNDHALLVLMHHVRPARLYCAVAPVCTQATALTLFGSQARGQAVCLASEEELVHSHTV